MYIPHTFWSLKVTSQPIWEYRAVKRKVDVTPHVDESKDLSDLYSGFNGSLSTGRCTQLKLNPVIWQKTFLFLSFHSLGIGI